MDMHGTFENKMRDLLPIIFAIEETIKQITDLEVGIFNAMLLFFTANLLSY